MTDSDWPAWPDDWADRKAGHGCRLCQFMRTEDPAWGIRVFAGQVANGYLWARGQIIGYSTVIWRAGHVCEPTELSATDAALFWTDVLAVGRALTVLLQPVKLNYEILGNAVPHLHAHVIPRGERDPSPNSPLPWSYLDHGRHPDGPLHALADDLRRLLPSADATADSRRSGAGGACG